MVFMADISMNRRPSFLGTLCGPLLLTLAWTGTVAAATTELRVIEDRKSVV